MEVAANGCPASSNFNTAPPKSDGEVAAEAWDKVLDFIRATPERARSIGDLFASFDTGGDGKKQRKKTERKK